MDERLKTILELFAQPAFFSKDGVVVWRNSAAGSLLNEGTSLHSILENEDSLFSKWSRSSTLNLSVFLGGCEYEVTVLACGEYDLFISFKRQAESNMEARALSRASVSLRKQLHSIVNAADSLFEQLPDEYSGSDAAAMLNQTIYRFIRLCGQMADGSQLLLGRKEAKKELIDLDRFFSDFVKQVKPLVASVGFDFQYHACPEKVQANVDSALLERALYNLLTNAITYTPKGGSILLKTEKQGHLFFISMIDDGDGIAPAVSPALFCQFIECNIGDPRRGTGLGLPIVREIARLHGGSLSVSNRTDPSGTVATFTISLARTPIQLHSKAIRYDYGGEFNHALIELSEVLEAKLYNPNEVQ